MNSLIHYLRRNNVFFLILVLLFSCKGTANLDTSGSSQGIKGQIVIKEGAFSTNRDMPVDGKIYGSEKEILVYELTSISEANLVENNFVNEVHSALVVSDFSNEHGTFTIKLEPGKYSVFVRENERLYSKFNQEEGYYFPVEVRKGKFEQVTFEIDYLARYE